MPTVKKYKYRNIEITIEVYEDGLFSGYALGTLSTSAHKTMEICIVSIESEVDKFLIITPKTYKELADAITSTLVWNSYEDCNADEFIIEILVNSFNSFKNPKF